MTSSFFLCFVTYCTTLNTSEAPQYTLDVVLSWELSSQHSMLDEVHVGYAVDYQSALKVYKSPAPLWSIYWEQEPPHSNINVRACIGNFVRKKDP